VVRAPSGADERLCATVDVQGGAPAVAVRLAVPTRWRRAGPLGWRRLGVPRLKGRVSLASGRPRKGGARWTTGGREQATCFATPPDHVAAQAQPRRTGSAQRGQRGPTSTPLPKLPGPAEAPPTRLGRQPQSRPPPSTMPPAPRSARRSRADGEAGRAPAPRDSRRVSSVRRPSASARRARRLRPIDCRPRATTDLARAPRQASLKPCHQCRAKTPVPGVTGRHQS
jgi:hypothetical protein